MLYDFKYSLLFTFQLIIRTSRKSLLLSQTDFIQWGESITSYCSWISITFKVFVGARHQEYIIPKYKH